MDLSLLCVLAAYQNNLGDVKNDDVTSGLMSPGRKRPNGGKELRLKIDYTSEVIRPAFFVDPGIWLPMPLGT